MYEHVRCPHQVPIPAADDTEPFTASADRSDTYSVFVCKAEPCAEKFLLNQIDGRRVALVTDDTVAGLHAERLANSLRRNGIDVAMTSFPPGEANKSIDTAVRMLDWLAGTSIARRDIILSVGGGVVIDTIGWVASAYMRGVPYINVPTTLLGQVDAALGGKVAVDHPSAKNLIGCFYQPKAVVSNVAYLSTLDRRQIAAGLAEAIKKGVIGSPELFRLIEDNADRALNRDLPSLEQIVRAASVVKSQLIELDPYEDDLRRPLNFGHTVGHAVETVTGYGPVLHGEAVAYGMTIAAEIAVRRGMLSEQDRSRLVGLLNRCDLPTSTLDLPSSVRPGAVTAALGQIRKIRDSKIRFVLPVEYGCTVIADDVTDDEVAMAMATTRETALAEQQQVARAA
jgi:3-dehydroquinate synthase